MRVSDDDAFVEPWEVGTAGDGEGEDLGVDFGTDCFAIELELEAEEEEEEGGGGLLSCAGGGASS